MTRRSKGNGSANPQRQLVDLGVGWYRIVNRVNGMVIDSWGNTALDGMGNSTAGSTLAMRTPNNSTNNQWTVMDV
ncbi:hypothetical protein [Nonomuraea sp. NPDC049784]|uniref:hypothetical protein n=1 Tax=Nonomuraea sp. NPDC049784 TaxID=3154361 RepID=UPI0033C14CB0